MAVENAILQGGFFSQVLRRILELITAPKMNPDMLWLVIPLIITLLLMTFYFGRYEYEEIGWNTAVGNSLVLFFISIDLIRQIYNGNVGGILHPSLLNFEINSVKTAISISLLFIAIFLLIINFTHSAPKKISFFLSSPLPINLTAYIVMTIVYTNVVFDRFTLIASLVIFFMLLGLIQLIKLLERIFLKWATKGEIDLIPKNEKKN